jgi:hypothetical protein
VQQVSDVVLPVLDKSGAQLANFVGGERDESLYRRPFMPWQSSPQYPWTALVKTLPRCHSTVRRLYVVGAVEHRSAVSLDDARDAAG